MTRPKTSGALKGLPTLEDALRDLLEPPPSAEELKSLEEDWWKTTPDTPESWQQVFREATWEEALDFSAKGLRDIRDTHGKRALAGFGSAKGTNEEAYLFQKLVRTGFGSNNVCLLYTSDAADE